jgi:hypothetical protein
MICQNICNVLSSEKKTESNFQSPKLVYHEPIWQAEITESLGSCPFETGPEEDEARPVCSDKRITLHRRMVKPFKNHTSWADLSANELSLDSEGLPMSPVVHLGTGLTADSKPPRLIFDNSKNDLELDDKEMFRSFEDDDESSLEIPNSDYFPSLRSISSSDYLGSLKDPSP